MTYWAPITIGLLILVLALLPAAFLIFAAIVSTKKLQGTPSKLLTIGAILLAIASLDSTFNYFGAYFLDAQSIADIIIYTSVIFEGLNIVALILIGIGLIKLSKMVSSREAPSEYQNSA
jgi:hypothetical protein